MVKESMDMDYWCVNSCGCKQPLMFLHPIVKLFRWFIFDSIKSSVLILQQISVTGWVNVKKHDKEALHIPKVSYKGTQKSPWALQACNNVAMCQKIFQRHKLV